jgi:hypothetical protein
MLKAAAGRLMSLGLSKAKSKALARTGVDMYVARVRQDVKEGKAYVEAKLSEVHQ